MQHFSKKLNYFFVILGNFGIIDKVDFSDQPQHTKGDSMAGKGMNSCGTKSKKGRQSGLKTANRTKPVPTTVALKRERQKENAKKNKRW